nr:MAG TPA_asm: hypothetical protein [Bacteriophage sp.]
MTRSRCWYWPAAPWRLQRSCRRHLLLRCPPPETAKPAPPSTVPRSGAAEAAELKHQTLARLEAYRRTDGLASFTPLAELCDEVDGKSVTPEMLGRMLGRERFPVAIWRAVAAALDKMEQKKGADEDSEDD